MPPTECCHGHRPGPTVDLRRPALARPFLQACLERFRPLFPRRDQAASFGAYAGEGGATLVHRRLFLSEAWTGDAAYVLSTVLGFLHGVD